MHCFLVNMWYRSENYPQAMCVFVSTMSTSRCMDHSILCDICLICLHVAKKNNAAKFLVSLKQSNSEGFIGAPSLYLQHSWTLIWCLRILSLFIRPLNFTQNDLCATSDQKTRTSMSRKICCIKSGFQILYAVKQFSPLFSKHTKPMIHLPCACRGRTAVQFPASSSHVFCVERALKGLASTGKGLL